MKPLAEQVALVTGGSRGIGKAICEKLASQGASVIVNYASRSDAADEVGSAIAAAGGNASVMGFDVSDADAVDEAVKQITAEHGRIDILINNAGIAIDGLIMRTKKEDWQRTIDVNLTGAFNCARAVAKPMMKARHGRIVNISSVIGQSGNAGQVAYSASKAGLFGVTKSLAKELATRGITVNAIAPGYIETEMTAEMDEKTQQAILSNIPMNRIGTADDVAELTTFLCCPGSSYITGQVIAVNGGMYM